MGSLRVSEDRVWETELVGGRELWGPLIRSPRSRLGPLVQASWKCQPAELWRAVGLWAQDEVAGWATSLPGCPRIGPIRVCRASLASRSLSKRIPARTPESRLFTFTGLVPPLTICNLAFFFLKCPALSNCLSFRSSQDWNQPGGPPNPSMAEWLWFFLECVRSLIPRQPQCELGGDGAGLGGGRASSWSSSVPTAAVEMPRWARRGPSFPTPGWPTT